MSSEQPTRKPRSFRGQLTTIVTIGILALGLAGAFSSAWVTKVHIEDQLFENGLKITESLANQSVLSLIYDSPENAENAATAAMGFPAVKQVAIISLDGKILLSKGGALEVPDISSIGEEVRLLIENLEFWLFAAPVYLKNSEQAADDPQTFLFQPEQKQELLGYVLVKKGKEKIGQVFTAAIVNNLTIGLLIALLLLAIIRLYLNRLISPLDKLADVMARAEEGDTKANAKLEGPREVIDIARAYNKMIEALAQHQLQLKSHNELLEYEVEARTRDLVYARDMAIEASRNKSNFLSNVSHELRTPLQSILGYSDLIQEALPDDMDDIQHDLNTIIKNAENLLHMINSVLDMSKIEAGHIEINVQETDLDPLLENLVETIKPLMAANSNRIVFTKNLDQPVINIDKDKLRQIMLNLLGNATKFTHNGTITFTVEQTNKTLIIQVQDSGIGMDKGQVDHIFEPFYQIDGSHTRRYEGSGLGLAITHQFCELMDGTISVTSELNQGSTFRVEIPYN